MKIAVFLNDMGQTAPLWQPGTVTLFTREGQRWQACQRVPLMLTPEMPLDELRQRTLAMLASLHDCRHFVAEDIHGALRAWLDGTGITMWKCAGRPEDFLERIAGQTPAPVDRVVLLPEAFILPAGREGEFRVDLMAALQSGGTHTSRRLLMPFFTARAFTRLEIVCDHLPKWFDTLPGLQLSASQQIREDGTLCVVVTPDTTTVVP